MQARNLISLSAGTKSILDWGRPVSKTTARMLNQKHSFERHPLPPPVENWPRLRSETYYACSIRDLHTQVEIVKA
jgi:hypothetical protein